MSGRIKITTETRGEEANEASIVLLSADKAITNTTTSCSKFCSFSNSDLNSCCFPQEIEYLEYLPPLAGLKKDLYQEYPLFPQSNVIAGDLDDSSLMPIYNPASSLSEDEFTPSSFTPDLYSLEESVECCASKVVQITSERKTSILTTVCESSIDESVASTVHRLGVHKEIPSRQIPNQIQQQKFHSVKISIGAFNSVDQAKDFSTTTVKGASSSKYSLNLDKAASSDKAKHCCNCKKSRCLKLYCECFANGTFCQGCNCVECLNIVEHEEKIQDARLAVSEKNPIAFKRRISEEGEGKQPICCNCSKSGCLKKYCECFKNGHKCGSGCNCTACKNTAALRSISYKKCEKLSKKVCKKVSLQHLV